MSAKCFLTITLSTKALFNLLFEILLRGSAGSIRWVFWCCVIKNNGAFIFAAELMSSWNFLPVFTGFLSVDHDSKDNIKLLVIASFKVLCISGLEPIVGIYRDGLLIVTLTTSSPTKLWRKSRCLFDVFNSCSKPRPLVIFYKIYKI